MNAVVLATRNKGKIREFSEMLQNFQLNVLGLDDFPEIGEIEETGVTFEANARIKASEVAKATGLVAIADDSGLEVDALDGAPGVFSARFSAPNPTDEKNNALLLEKLQGVPYEKRTARFRCVMLAYAPDGQELCADGSWEGHIAEQPEGDNGFGYDPLFVDSISGKHSACLSRDEKNARSHRGKALRKLLEDWPFFWGRVKHS
ncbi:XTP/dITP diphosphohydrolase [Desulfobaculum bizertense DSM 18034]|uniref:dITP/XTP pyrophosphatase n=1 Tax=Desulfobaculum bizertense DSM 18034 TaxID=1121442 RepID=A0A1T4WJM4_9BACT|nr:XTP/dITP diphosphohydrolase [Desulfobaculum bizertense DSM 18034]